MQFELLPERQLGAGQAIALAIGILGDLPCGGFQGIDRRLIEDVILRTRQDANGNLLPDVGATTADRLGIEPETRRQVAEQYERFNAAKSDEGRAAIGRVLDAMEAKVGVSAKSQDTN